MTFMAWPEIEAFHNIRKYAYSHPEILKGQSLVQYRAKVKLHGTNSAIQILADGTILTQSRSQFITPENDNAGFARWVNDNKHLWLDSKDGARKDVIIYGEWCGSGIQKGVAISGIGKRVFAVFAVRPLGGAVAGTPIEDILWTEPDVLQEIVKGIPDTYVLPWYGSPIDIDWAKLPTEFVNETTTINQWVESIETNDPWVEQTFGVKGTGEGLVLYPVSEAHQGYNAFKDLVFKAKGEAHKNVKTAAPAQVDPAIANGIDSFVEMVLTPARLEQGVNTVGGLDVKLTGKFVGWCLSDVEKENTDELEASGLTWNQVQKSLTDKARLWYLREAKK